ncbi:hypothetical protein D9M71_127700 [compost metagenome]
MSIDWSNAPEDATHGHKHSHGVDFYKREDGLWLYLTPRGKWEFAAGTNESCCETRPEARLGEGLPPVGSTVRVSKDGWEIWDVAEQFIGVDVTLVARFMTGDTEMVAVEHPVIRQCCCFRSDMIRTPEQIAAEERNDAQKDIKHIILTSFKIDPVTASSIAGVIADSQYRKVTP